MKFIYTHLQSLICLKPLSNYQQFSSALSAKNQHSLKYRRQREHSRRRRKKPSRVCDSKKTDEIKTRACNDDLFFSFRCVNLISSWIEDFSKVKMVEKVNRNNYAFLTSLFLAIQKWQRKGSEETGQNRQTEKGRSWNDEESHRQICKWIFLRLWNMKCLCFE